MKNRYGYQHLGTGLGQAIGALINGDKFEKAGRLDGEKQLGEIMRQRALAEKAQAEADAIRQRMESAASGRQDFLRGQTGLVDPNLKDLEVFNKTGSWGSYELMGPPNPGQRSMPTAQNAAPDWYTPDVSDRYNRAMSTLGLNSIAPKDSNAAQLGDALESLAKVGNVDAMIGGNMDPNIAAAAYGAVQGKPVYDQGTQGVLNQYTGDVAGTPKLGAEISALNALAAQRSAGADANTALAEQRRMPGAAGGGRPPAMVATLEYLQTSMGMSPEQALTWMQTAKMNPVKAAVDLASKRYAADAEAAAASFGEVPMPDFDTYLQEAQQQVQQLLNPINSGAAVQGAAPSPDDPLGLMQ